ncbi:MAG: glycosyltransferase [Lachnospiraceae bacterium]|nr:glycosyltransferase [Lachnospiraceae bacterium]
MAKVSVITPVCRTPLPLFEEAFWSLKNGKMPFDEIEWLVGIHNMDDDYAAGLRRMTGDCKNIRFLRAEGGDSPSVPRNRCLESATGDYIFFLDSDDKIAADCLSGVTAAMDETGADIAVFGYGFIASDGVEPVFGFSRCGLNAPDGEMVLYERGDPRILSLTAEWGACIWCRAYRHSFLLKAGARFDEDARIAEDVKFNLAVTPKAKRVCVLPRMKGYFHRVWEGSLTQARLPQVNSEEALRNHYRMVQDNGAVELLWNYLFVCAKTIIADKGKGESVDWVFAALAPILQGMRVMAPRFTMTRDYLEKTLGFCSVFFNIPAEPRLRQKRMTIPKLLSENALRSRLLEAAAENVELRTVATEGAKNPFLGIERKDARPQAYFLDLRRMAPERQMPHIESYCRMEMQRGFLDGEVRCRVTVFSLSGQNAVFSVTWDDRFVGGQSIKRLCTLAVPNLETDSLADEKGDA